MPNPINRQETLFPTRDTVEQVIQEGKAMLPITNQNDLVALLQLQMNTVINLTAAIRHEI